MSGAIASLSVYAFVMCVRQTLSFLLQEYGLCRTFTIFCVTNGISVESRSL